MSFTMDFSIDTIPFFFFFTIIIDSHSCSPHSNVIKMCYSYNVML